MTRRRPKRKNGVRKDRVSLHERMTVSGEQKGMDARKGLPNPFLQGFEILINADQDRKPLSPPSLKARVEKARSLMRRIIRGRKTEDVSIEKPGYRALSPKERLRLAQSLHFVGRTLILPERILVRSGILNDGVLPLIESSYGSDFQIMLASALSLRHGFEEKDRRMKLILENVLDYHFRKSLDSVFADVIKTLSAITGNEKGEMSVQPFDRQHYGAISQEVMPYIQNPMVIGALAHHAMRLLKDRSEDDKDLATFGLVTPVKMEWEKNAFRVLVRNDVLIDHS